MGLGRLFIRESLAYAKAAPHGPLRVILMRNVAPEQSHHPVARGFRHHAACPLDLRPQERLVGMEECLDLLDVELLGSAGESDKVGEQDGDDAAFPPFGRWRFCEGCRACSAESEPVWVFSAALGACRHAGEYPPVRWVESKWVLEEGGLEFCESGGDCRFRGFGRRGVTGDGGNEGVAIEGGEFRVGVCRDRRGAPGVVEDCNLAEDVAVR